MKWLGSYHQFNGHEFEQTPGDSERQRSLGCCSPWGHRAGHNLATEQQQLHPPWGDLLVDLQTFPYPSS